MADKPWGNDPEMLIPVPQMAPFGDQINIDSVREVWNAFVKPDQDAGNVQSVEMRLLMAILRATFAGFMADGQTERSI